MTAYDAMQVCCYYEGKDGSIREVTGKYRLVTTAGACNRVFYYECHPDRTRIQPERLIEVDVAAFRRWAGRWIGRTGTPARAISYGEPC